MKNSIKRVQSESSLSALSSVRILREAKKIFQYILMAVAVVATASCSNELDEALQPAGNGTLQFVVSDFPAFGESPETRAIETQDEGKTVWKNGDQILVHLYSQKYKDQAVTLTLENDYWTSDGDITLSYLENEEPMITAVYAPDCGIKSDKTIGLLEGKKYGEAEYIPATTSISRNVLKISFESERTYSRLRIVGLEKQDYTVTTTGFTPAGPEGTTAPTSYTLTTDNKGNAYLYGIFEKDATVKVNHSDVALKDYTFTAETEQGKSYALDARPIIDGTLGGKTEASEDDVAALVDQLKTYVNNGITTITVTGENPAIIDMGNYTSTAICEAIYRLSEEASYNGKIDLILSDVTEIIDYEFKNAYALNSITLPNVTKLGYQAFYDCQYLKKITFGSVVTEGTPDALDFHNVGTAVGGCDLVLNRGQATAAAEYQPNIEAKNWWETIWNKIELI